MGATTHGPYAVPGLILSVIPTGLADGLMATLVTATMSHLTGVVCGLALVMLLAFNASGRHILQAIGFAIIATPILICSFLMTSTLGASALLPAAMGMLPSLALTLLIGADSVLSAQRNAPLALVRQTRRPAILFWTCYTPHVLIGALTALVLSFPATLLYVTFGELVSGSSSPSMGRLMVGTIPSGRLGQLSVLALCLCVMGGAIWGSYGAFRLLVIRRLRISDQDIEDQGAISSSSTLSSVFVPLTAITIVLLALIVGSRLVGDQLLVRSPEVALAALGSDYVSLYDIASMTFSLLSKAIIAALLATLIGYALTVTLPHVLIPLRIALLGSALVVQIVPIIIIAAILWMALPELPARDLLVATLSGLYPAFQIMRERQATIPNALSDLMATRGTCLLRSQWLVRGPWALSAVPTAILATVPFSVNALIASDYILRGDGLGHWLYAINARGEVTMVQGMFLVILVCSLLSSSLLISMKRIVDKNMAGPSRLLPT